MTNEKNYISQEETLNKINALIAEYIPLMPIGWTLPLNIAKTINEIPTVTLSRPKGKWKPLNYKDEMWGYVYKCSNCGAIEYGGDYCPGCGADMREKADKE